MSAASSLICRPVMYSARFSAWVPMSPMQPAGAGALGIGAPGRLLLAGGLQARGQPALRVLDHDLADLAQLAGGHQVAGFLHQRVAGVVVGETVEQAGLLHQRGQLLRLGEVEGRGLVAQSTWNPLFSASFGGREMHVVGGDDGEEVHALVRRQLGLGRDHLLERPVATLGREVEVGAGAFERWGSDENAPQTSSTWPIHVAAAMRCTAPMNAPRPPPTMP
jgi:hypothetical protein